MKATPVFEWNYKADSRIVVNQGGTWSSKTFSVLQALLLKLIQGPGGEVCTITAETLPSLRMGAIRDFNAILDQNSMRWVLSNTNRSENKYVLLNGSVLEFRAYPDALSAEHGKRDYLFINEANHVQYEIAQKLIMKTRRQVYIDFNPTAMFWAHETYQGDSDAVWFYSTYRQNPFCDPSVIAEIEGLKERSPELYKVYGLGRRGSLQGQIFGSVNWVASFPDVLNNRTYGLDVGFTNSVTALCELGMAGGKIYGRELIYERGLRDSQIAERCRDLGISSSVPLVVDSANQATIAELQESGFNAMSCKKRDVAREIQWMLEYSWNVTNESSNWKKEAVSYLYDKDKRSGQFLNKPANAGWDHMWDAARYAFLEMVGGEDLPQFL